MARDAHELATELNAHRNAFKAFLTSRVGSAAEAEDILQNGLAKAVQRADSVHDEGNVVPWFYQLLRNSIVDHYRSRGSSQRRHEGLAEMIAALGEDVAAAPNDWAPQLCTCLAGVVGTLKPQHAELLRRVDLNGESVQTVAHDLKLTPNNASVILHRARKDLRARLVTFCGECADGACLDCDCAERD
ncbi:MAG: sigma-70 family RNA polymerase sigma factor [Cephaloticoccus sp.]|nr:sigma-70 family RNA polymerase sigma factor [Cephaloticoccus sp.]MCF7760541.1 sigma-70 family RNA polymerase sigma factor [Cephaloticoccus sp.]